MYKTKTITLCGVIMVMALFLPGCNGSNVSKTDVKELSEKAPPMPPGAMASYQKSHQSGPPMPGPGGVKGAPPAK